MSNYATISRSCWNANQSWNLDRIVKVLGPIRTGSGPARKLRVEIRRNSYDDQSHARVSVWTEGGWAVVAQKPIGECRSSAVHYTTRELTDTQEFLFDRDADELLDIAVQVIS